MKDNHNIKLITVVGLFSFLTSLSGASVNLALPQISSAFNVANSTSTWVLQTGLITTAVFLVFFGHLGDLISKNLVFIYGGILFVAGSGVNGIAASFSMLIIGRFIQAIGAAMVMANTMGIITEAFPDQQRAEALAVNSMFISVGAISGPALGGFIMAIFSWRWIFLINIPVGIIVLTLGFKVLPKPKKSVKSIVQTTRSVNWPGQFLFTLGMVILFLSASFFQGQHIRPGLGIIFLLSGIALTTYSFIQDDRAKNPWISPMLLHNATYMLSITTLFLAMMINVFSNVLLPFYLQNFLGLDAFVSGLLMGIQSLIMLIIAPIVGYLADKFNRMHIVLIGLIVLLVSQVGYMLFQAQLNLVIIIGVIFLNGVGMGLFISPNNALTMGVIESKYDGVGGSLSSFARTLGMSLGVSFASTMLFLQLPGVRVITASLGDHFLVAFHRVFMGAAILSLVAILLVVYRIIKANQKVA